MKNCGTTFQIAGAELDLVNRDVVCTVWNHIYKQGRRFIEISWLRHTGSGCTEKSDITCISVESAAILLSHRYSHSRASTFQLDHKRELVGILRLFRKKSLTCLSERTR